MRSMIWLLLLCGLLLSGLLLVTACSDDANSPSNTTNPDPDPDPDPQISLLTVVIDGAAWQAEILTTYGDASSLEFSGWTPGDTSFGLAIYVAITDPEPRQYFIGPDEPDASVKIREDDRWWLADSMRGSGTLTISSVTAERAVGSFTVTAELDPDSGDPPPESRAVTFGVFEVNR